MDSGHQKAWHNPGTVGPPHLPSAAAADGSLLVDITVSHFFFFKLLFCGIYMCVLPFSFFSLGFI